MKNKILGFFMVFITIFMMSSCAERIDAGHEGIQFNLAGSEKGVDDVALVSGWVFYNPFTTGVYEYPTFAQTIDYEPFEINSKDGTKFTVDPSMIVKITDGKSPAIFRKYRKPLEEVINGSLYIYVKDAARVVFNKYSADSIVSHRELVDKSLDDYVRATFIREGFTLEQLTPGISYPKSYEDAINAKNRAIQDEMRIANEVKVAEAEAKKAEAEAKKCIVAAEAEAEANRLRTQTLTPQVLEKAWIDKWDGKLPVYGQVPTIFKTVSK